MGYLDTLLQSPQLAQGGLPQGELLTPPAGAPNPQPQNELPTPVRPGPPTSPQELQERQSGWATLMQKLETDPIYSATLLRLGTSLMQPVPVGQTPLGQGGLALQDAMNYFTGQQAERRKAGLEYAASGREDVRVGLEARRTATGEQVAGSQIQSAEVGRRAAEQQIQQNEKLFPQTLRKIDQEIAASVSRGIVDEAQAEFLRQRARLYPQEVNAELARARAAETAAGKPGEADILMAVARATARAEGITEDEALARLGGARYGRAQGAGAQTLIQQERIIRQANPKQEGETDAAYNQRISGLVQKHMQTSKAKDRATARQEFITNNPYFAKTPQEAAKMFDDLNPPEEAGPAPAKPVVPKAGETKGKVKYPYAPSDPASRTAGTVYDTPRGPMKWTGTGWLPGN